MFSEANILANARRFVGKEFDTTSTAEELYRDWRKTHCPSCNRNPNACDGHPILGIPRGKDSKIQPE